jgi:hypothetical protein
MPRITWRRDTPVDPSTLTLEDKVDIFYEQVWGWQIHVAELMMNGGPDQDGNSQINPLPHSGYAALSVLVSYFELIGQCINGATSSTKSRQFFVDGLVEVFPQLENYPFLVTRDFVDYFYSGLRCGLYHSSLAGSRIGIVGVGDPIQFGGQPVIIQINPHALPSALHGHLQHYVARLKDPASIELRNKFRQVFDVVHR